ncbi:MAG: hypothetical protein RID81_42770, partial [Sandaracinaceae bacterium]
MWQRYPRATKDQRETQTGAGDEDADIGPITLRAGDRAAELRKGSPGYSPLRLDEALWSTGGERVTVVSE